MNMNRLSKQCMVFIAGMISFLYVLGLVGHQDYIEEILYNMPQETYDVIVQKLGNVSRSEIAAEYEANRWVGGRYVLERLVAERKIRMAKPGDRQNSEWKCNAEDVLRHAFKY